MEMMHKHAKQGQPFCFLGPCGEEFFPQEERTELVRISSLKRNKVSLKRMNKPGFMTQTHSKVFSPPPTLERVPLLRAHTQPTQPTQSPYLLPYQVATPKPRISFSWNVDLE
jgi:hypothetical protein